MSRLVPEWRSLFPPLVSYPRVREVEIPATYGLEKGVWIQFAEGIKGKLVADELGQPHVFMLTQPASHYYEVMTRHDRMPVFLEAGI
jgi:hypothetical protein